MLARIFEMFSGAAQSASVIETQIALAVTQEINPNLSTLSKSIRLAERTFQIEKTQLNNDFAKWQREFAAEPEAVATDYLKYLKKLEKKFNDDKNRLLKKKTTRRDIESTIDYKDATKNLEKIQGEISRVNQYLASKQKSSTKDISHRLQSRKAQEPIVTSRVVDFNFSSDPDADVFNLQIQGKIAYFLQLPDPWDVNSNYYLISAEISKQNMWSPLSKIPIFEGISAEYSYLNEFRSSVSMVMSGSRAFLSSNWELHYNNVAFVQIFDTQDPANLVSAGSIPSSSVDASIVDLVPSKNPDFLFAATFTSYKLSPAQIYGLHRINIGNSNFSTQSYPPSRSVRGYYRIVMDEAYQYLVGVHETTDPNFAMSIGYNELHVYKMSDDGITPEFSKSIILPNSYRLRDLVVGQANAFIYLEKTYWHYPGPSAQLQMISLEEERVRAINITESVTGPGNALATSGNRLYLARGETQTIYAYDISEGNLDELWRYNSPVAPFGLVNTLRISGSDIFVSSYVRYEDSPGWHYANKLLIISQPYEFINCRVNITQFNKFTLLNQFNFLVSGVVDPKIIVYGITGWDAQIKGQPYGSFVRNFTQEQINRHLVYGIFYNNVTTTVSVTVPGRDPIFRKLQFNYILSEIKPAPLPAPVLPNPSSSSSTPSGILVAIASIGFGCGALAAGYYCRRRNKRPAAPPIPPEAQAERPEAPIPAVAVPAIPMAELKIPELKLDIPVRPPSPPPGAVEIIIEHKEAKNPPPPIYQKGDDGANEPANEFLGPPPPSIDDLPEYTSDGGMKLFKEKQKPVIQGNRQNEAEPAREFKM